MSLKYLKSRLTLAKRDLLNPLQWRKNKMANEEYYQTVGKIEQGLALCAKRSFEAGSPVFVDGGDIHAFYSDQWKKDPSRLRERTPLQLERDKILYSQGMRKQTEKYHVLYNGQRRIVRSYATHTMKMAQVTRAICRGLNLNQDFAEAVALGAKVGAVPFVHAAKHAMNDWAVKKIDALDGSKAPASPIGNHGRLCTLRHQPRRRVFAHVNPRPV